ncbi:MAG TPA: hypothetical protein VHA74_04010 [Candidatus Dojkabacteria bacterium]|nr:hypothetical protein [Candidatus Dojkabacteria bacterium]
MSVIKNRRYSSDGKTFYDVNQLIELSKGFPILKVPLKDLEHNLRDECWGDDNCGVSKEMRTPLNVYKNRDKGEFFKKHYDRAMELNLETPILIDKNNNIIDGNHRLLKAFIQNKEFIPAIRFNELPESTIIK